MIIYYNENDIDSNDHLLNRSLVGFSKTPNQEGEFIMMIEYDLIGLKTSELVKILGLEENKDDPNLLGCYDVDSEQIRKLKKYLNDINIDLNKYDYCVECS